MRILFVLALLYVVQSQLPAGVAAEVPDTSPHTWQGKTAAEWGSLLTLTSTSEVNIPVRWYAAYALGQLGPGAADALPALHKTLETKSDHEYIRGTSAWAIGRIVPGGEGEVDLLRTTISSKLASVRRNSAHALGGLGKAAHAAIPELLKMLSDDDAVVRVEAAAAVWKIDRNSQGVKFLIAALKDKDATTAYQAAVTLGELPEPPESVGPALVAAFHSSDADVRRAAARSAGSMKAAVFPALKQAHPLDDDKPDVRLATVDALSWMGPIAVKPLMAALKNSVPEVRRDAATALASLGAAAKSAEPSLLTAASDSNEEVGGAAAKALRRLQVNATEPKVP